MELSIIRKNQKKHITSQHVMWISVILLLTLLGCLAFRLLPPHPVSYALIFLFFITPIGTNLYSNSEYYPINFEIVSKLKIELSSIKLGEKQFEFNSIKKIEFRVNDWFGKKIEYNVRPYEAGPTISRGINNKIKLFYWNLTEEEFHFQLESEDMYFQLSYCLTDLYTKNIDIYETYENIRSYGLRHLNYSEIQDFKKFILNKKSND